VLFHDFWEVTPTSPWNYAILEDEIKNNRFEIEVRDEIAGPILSAMSVY